MPKKFMILIICSLSVAWRATASGSLADRLEGLRAADIRVGTVLFRLSRANDELCEKHAPLTGLILHSSASYDADVRADVIRYFGFESPLGVEGVVPGSPAAQAGIVADDSILAIDGSAIPADASRQSVQAVIDGRGPTQPVSFRISRAGKARLITLQPVQGCLAHVEIDVSGALNAATDGNQIQVDSALVNLVGNDNGALAAILAHELAHIVLNHPARLTEAHVDRGLFKGFGRSARLFKRTEREADRLSVTLLANAAYDPGAAQRYWLTYGPRLTNGGLGSTHQSWRERARLIGTEVQRVSQETRRPIVPSWIVNRDQPLG